MDASIIIQIDEEVLTKLDEYTRLYETDLSFATENFLKALLTFRPDEDDSERKPGELRFLGVRDLVPESELQVNA